MNLPTIKHEDNRRKLIEWISDFPIRCCKILIMKENGEVGGHYHNKKIDTFYLLKGGGTFEIGDTAGTLIEGGCYRATMGELHTFKLKAGSILLEASTTPFDKNDENKVFKTQ